MANLSRLRSAIDGFLEQLAAEELPGGDPVSDAARWLLLAPAKRVRPTLLLLVADLFGTKVGRCLLLASIVELVHTASLLLDDLPCMDNSPMRRGREAAHVKFGEHIAILAAFKLLSLAHGMLPQALAKAGVALPKRSGEAMRLASTVGKLCDGQRMDLDGSAHRLEELEEVHAKKTGALFVLAARWGALAGKATEAEEEAVVSFARNLGLAFQVVDDVLDSSGDPTAMGKPAGQDLHKPTFVKMIGINGCMELAKELVDTAISHLEPFGPKAAPLIRLAEGVLLRER